MISGLWENKLINVATVLVLLAIATYIAYRGIDTTEHVQLVLVSFQLVMLLLFTLMAIAKSGASEVGEPFSWSWFSPAGLTLSAFITGLSFSIFAFWGWDTALTVNEESKNSDTTPGRAALLCVLSILLTYLLVSVATQMYAGLGESGLGLTNPEVSDNVFGNLAVPILGHPLDLALFLAVLASSAASLITTFLPTSRTLLAMGSYRAMPKAFAKLHPVHKTPKVATFTAGIGAATFYTVMTVLSERVLTDTILALGIMICFYYGLTAFGCIWFFRHQLFSSAYNVVFKFLFPLLGGLGLFFVLIITLRDSADPAYGSGASIGGIGLVLILGLGLILLGLIFMFIMRARQPEFFRGETIIHESAHAMRPHEHLVS
jgi:amino acid transporter